MERHELNIPTIYSHSIFVDKDEIQNNLTKNQFDYFWAIVYLYKTKLLSIKQHGLTKHKREDDKTFYQLNPETIWDDTPIEIEYYEIRALFKDENDSKYQSLRDFMEYFGGVHLKTNIFGKDPKPSQIVKPVKQLSVTLDNQNIVLVLSDEFIKPLLLTSEFFKKVTLNFLFALPTEKAKALYLIFKDYDKFSKNFTKDEIESVVGNVFNNQRIIGILNYINDLTDIKIIPKRLRTRKLAHTYKVTHQLKFINDEEEREYFVKKLIRREAEARTQKALADGTDTKSEEAYIRKVFGQIINDADEYDKYENMAIIDIFLKDKKQAFINEIPEDYTGYSYTAINIELSGETKSYLVDDNYLLRETRFPTTITRNAEQTYIKIQNKIDTIIYYTDNELQDATKSLIK